MSSPIIAQIEARVVNLEKGKEYYFCTCGRSKSQPFCDNSHAGTDFAPKLFVADISGDAYLCNCKNSAIQPFCDGSHSKFSDSDIGKEI